MGAPPEMYKSLNNLKLLYLACVYLLFGKTKFPILLE